MLAVFEGHDELVCRSSKEQDSAAQLYVYECCVPGERAVWAQLGQLERSRGKWRWCWGSGAELAPDLVCCGGGFWCCLPTGVDMMGLSFLTSSGFLVTMTVMIPRRLRGGLFPGGLPEVFWRFSHKVGRRFWFFFFLGWLVQYTPPSSWDLGLYIFFWFFPHLKILKIFFL